MEQQQQQQQQPSSDRRLFSQAITTTEPSFSSYYEIIPSLSNETHKGQGAIKSYSPDLIVHPLIKVQTLEILEQEIAQSTGSSTTDVDAAHAKRIKKLINKIEAQSQETLSGILERIHVLVIGPGLSRDNKMQAMARFAIQKAREIQLPIVVDADGLFLVQNEPDLVQGYKRAILTPNLVEFKRLCTAKNVSKRDAQTLSEAFGGVIVVQKGKHDVIANGSMVYEVTNTGGLKRSGGQGDLLTGMIATALAWIVANGKKPVDEEKMDKQFMVACYGACMFTRRCSQLAFKKHRRAVQSSDILDEIGPFFAESVEKANPNDTWHQVVRE
ncbi:hypothetical protein BGZ94_005779 [Podila epigama]|nr:hypothetical protein BGZ94_005779 [Podila epigama]